MKKYLIYAGALLFSAFTMQSCLDYDNPGDELGLGSIKLEGDVPLSNYAADFIDYRFQLDNEEQLKSISEALKVVAGQAQAAQFCLRGGKNAELPGAHAYQYQYTNSGPDLYAQYFVVPHWDFEFGPTITSSYDLSDYRGNSTGAYTMAKNAVMPLLYHASVDSVPEIKAIALLLYSFAAQEAVDNSGALTYFEDKQNSENPRTYNDIKTIYYNIVNNLDTIVACLKNYENRPDWYKKNLNARRGLLKANFGKSAISGDNYIDVYMRMANSLKLRMAMNIVKVEPETARKWAEEAVASGVVEAANQQSGLSVMGSGVQHPLREIATESWQDAKLCASFESILKSFNHPYLQYMFLKNDGDIVNDNTGATTYANSDVYGIRAGVKVGKGRLGDQNNYIYYSMLDRNVIKDCPLYYIKWAEVDFLRAEGAIRGWNMGDQTAEFYYNRGIDNACAQEPGAFSEIYTNAMAEYKNLDKPIEFIQKDPIGDGDDWPSVTKVGVKWNDGDDNETKLEKIITQKYIAMFPLSTVAWTDLRRTGYPKLFPVLNPDDGDNSLEYGDIIRRIPWVPSDPIAVEMVTESGIKALGDGAEDTQAQRLWWDVDVPNF